VKVQNHPVAFYSNTYACVAPKGPFDILEVKEPLHLAGILLPVQLCECGIGAAWKESVIF
jgi:hypothetical protein